MNPHIPGQVTINAETSTQMKEHFCQEPDEIDPAFSLHIWFRSLTTTEIKAYAIYGGKKGDKNAQRM